MSRRLRATIAVATLLAAACVRRVPDEGAASDTRVVTTGPMVDAAAIVALRDTLNAALVRRDVGPYARLWVPDVTLVAGSGSRTVGWDAGVARFRAFFDDSSFASGLRTPERVDVGEGAAAKAAEAGHWAWRVRNARGEAAARGRYLVMWQRTSDGWRVRSELYVTTACDGAGC